MEEVMADLNRMEEVGAEVVTEEEVMEVEEDMEDEEGMLLFVLLDPLLSRGTSAVL
jgi:hypothetical protein